MIQTPQPMVAPVQAPTAAPTPVVAPAPETRESLTLKISDTKTQIENYKQSIIKKESELNSFYEQLNKMGGSALYV